MSEESQGLKIVGPQIEPSIVFHPGDRMKEVMRIDRHGVRVNPEYSVDEITQHVLNALTHHIQHTVKHAVEQERRVMQESLDSLYALYQQACQQRDELMDQQRAQVEALRGRTQ